MSEAPGLPDFLLARIAEDEAVARGAGPFEWSGPESMGALGGSGTVMVDPARVLTECEARRRIVARFGWSGEMKGTVEWDTLCDLAAAYVDHPDHREEWKP